MRYWLNVGFLETEQHIPIARAAESLGYEGLALPDHLVHPSQIDTRYPYSADGEIGWSQDAPWPDCWVAIGAMAAATERLRYTTTVYVATLRDVFTVAKAVSTAASFGPGRVACGLGGGWMEEEFAIVGADFASRGPRFDEMLDALRLLWSGEEVEREGAHVAFPPLVMRPKAVGVPIWIGGNTGPALRRAAAHDGWIGAYTDLDGVTGMLADLAARRERAGRSMVPFEVLMTASPGASRVAGELEELGVHGICIPVINLATSPSTEDVLAGIERFAERRMR
jgi:probable F420-dependent oxidoreductase